MGLVVYFIIGLAFASVAIIVLRSFGEGVLRLVCIATTVVLALAAAGFGERIVRGASGGHAPAFWFRLAVDILVIGAGVAACSVVTHDRVGRPRSTVSLVDVAVGALAFVGGSLIAAIGLFIAVLGILYTVGLWIIT